MMLWIRRLGTLDPHTAFGEGRPMPPRVSPPDPEIAALHTTVEVCQPDDPGSSESIHSFADAQRPASYRTLTALRHSAVMGKTAVKQGRAPIRLDAHSPVWLI